MRGPSSSGTVRVAFFTRMDNPRLSRVGETALSPERSLGWPLVAAKEGVRGGTSKPRAKAAAKPHVLARGDEVASPKAASTMGSPTPGYDSIVDSVRAAAS
jgi:hypothetical protein